MSNIQKSHQINPLQVAAKAKKPDHPSKAILKPAQLLEAPETMRHEDVLAAQEQLGNQVVQRALDKKPHRREMNTDEQGNLNPKLADTIQQLRGGGSPLPETIQKEAGAKFGRGFKDVRVHVNDRADELSRSINARAFTIGSDIFFKNGVFAPGSSQGRETLIHELTHVVQQGGNRVASGKLKLGAPGTPLEKEAERVGKAHVQNNPKGATVTPGAASINRESTPGAEMQMQSDEDEIQMQPDVTTGVIQRITPEELELQKGKLKKPDEGSDIPEAPKLEGGLPKSKGKKNWARVEAPRPEGSIPQAPVMPDDMVGSKKPSPQVALTKGQKIKNAFSGAKRKIQTKVTGVDPESMQGKLKSQAGKLKKTEGHGIEDIEKQRAQKFKEFHSMKDEPDKEGKLQHNPSQAEKKSSSRGKLMSTIQNPDSKPEDIKKAQEQLDTLHKRSKTDRLKSFFTKGGSTKSYSEQALKTREKNLKTSAEGGDEKAFDLLKSEKAEKAKSKEGGGKEAGGEETKTSGKESESGGSEGKTSKAGKVGGLLGGAIGGFGKSFLGEMKAHFTGKRDEPEESKGEEKKAESSKGESKGTETGSSSSNANTGIGAMMEKYGELVKENQRLQEQLNGLKSKETKTETGSKPEEETGTGTETEPEKELETEGNL